MSEHTTTLIKGTRILDPNQAQLSVGLYDVALAGNRIHSIRPACSESPTSGIECIDAQDMCLMPGLINAHTHSPAAYAKGTVDIDNHPRFMWRNQGETFGRSAEEIYNCTLLSAIEMLETGTTAVIDHYPEQTFCFDDVTPVVKAYLDLGMRANIALRVFDEPYYDILPARDQVLPASLTEHLTAGPLAPKSAAEQLSLCASLIEAYDGAGDGLIRIMIGPSAPLRCSDAFLRGIVELAGRYGVGIHTHLLETPVAVEISRERFGLSLVQRMEQLGMLGKHVSCAHAIYVDEDDIERLSRTGTTVVHNPTSNLRIGDGVAPVLSMHRAGVPIAFGTDGASTNDNLNILEEIKLGTILQRVQGEPMAHWLSANDALSMALDGGARAIGRHGQLGAIAEGQLADFCLIDLNSLAFTPLNDLANQLVFADLGRSIRHVFVNGQCLVRNSEAVGVKRDEVLRRARIQRVNTMKRNSRLFDLAEQIGTYVS